MNRILIIISVIVGWVTGCQSMSHQEEFECLMNHQVGKLISSSQYRDHDEKKSLGDGKFDYIIRSKKSTCVWAFVIDENTGIIQSWHYISAPSVCRLHTTVPW